MITYRRISCHAFYYYIDFGFYLCYSFEGLPYRERRVDDIVFLSQWLRDILEMQNLFGINQALLTFGEVSLVYVDLLTVKYYFTKIIHEYREKYNK